MGRAVAKLKIELGKKKPIEARVWSYAYSAFVDANEILKQHERMLRLERRKVQSRLFAENFRKNEVPLPIEEKKSLMFACPKCKVIRFSIAPCQSCGCKKV
jgi:hypothetical protein